MKNEKTTRITVRQETCGFKNHQAEMTNDEFVHMLVKEVDPAIADLHKLG